LCSPHLRCPPYWPLTPQGQAVPEWVKTFESLGPINWCDCFMARHLWSTLEIRQWIILHLVFSLLHHFRTKGVSYLDTFNTEF
jgi:hypothetical protein